MSELFNFGQGGGVVVGVDKLEERPALQFL